jgi:DNA-binding transcriptional ArsR family regulator
VEDNFMAVEMNEIKIKSAFDSLNSRTAFFAMVADPIRHMIINQLLITPELSVNQIIKRLKKPQTLISYHLRCLRECGVLTKKRGENDSRKLVYFLHDPTFIKALFDMADKFLQEHQVCKDHPACQVESSPL